MYLTDFKIKSNIIFEYIIICIEALQRLISSRKLFLKLLLFLAFEK